MHGLKYVSASLTPIGSEAAALWLLLALPLAGALGCGVLWLLFPRRIGGRLAAPIAIAAMAATLVAAIAIVWGQLLPLAADQRFLRQPLWPLFTVGSLRVTLALVMDPLSAVMVLLASGLGALIFVYAAAYMRDDPARPRFFAFLSLFVFSMLLLVLADGFVALFLGWEGVGVCSYFLIGFWYRRSEAAAAAMKAFIVNRVGDVAFLIGIGLLLWALANVGTRPGEVGALQVEPVVASQSSSSSSSSSGAGEIRRRPPARHIPVGPTLSFAEMRDQLSIEIALPRAAVSASPATPAVHAYPARTLLGRMTVAGLPVAFLACVLIFLGAAGKSAQIPLYAWLPDAMAGPTPVSALIHAATLVTAGVYLLARLSFLFVLSPGALTLVATAGVLTALIGATASLVQNDLKRVLAYSTVSQLGYMFAAVAGSGFPGIFHVVTHGFFKACLFLAAGVIIHAVEVAGSDAAGGIAPVAGARPDPQDLRNMGGLGAALPWTRRAYFASCLALAGFPIASGFYSKDQIFAGLAQATGLAVSPSVLLGVLALTTFLTSCYAFRSYYLVFHARAPREPAPSLGPDSAHALEPRVMVAVVVALAVGAIAVGPLLGWPSNWTTAHEAPALARFLAPAFAANARMLTSASAEPAPVIEWGLQAGGLVLAVFGLLVARSLYRRGTPVAVGTEGERAAARRDDDWPRGWRRFIASGWGLDEAYRRLAVAPVLAAARTAASIDRRIFDRAVDGVATTGVAVARLVRAFDGRVVDGAVNGVSGGVLAAGRRTARLHNGRINSYVVAIVAGVAALIVLVYALAS